MIGNGFGLALWTSACLFDSTLLQILLNVLLQTVAAKEMLALAKVKWRVIDRRSVIANQTT